MTISPGARLGPYEVLAPLGAGGMGEVWRARDLRLGREVAVKVLPADLAKDPERLSRFEKEARAASALNHPNIVTIHEIGQADSVSYIAMELVEGRTVREIVASGSVPAKKLLGIAVQVADGLAKAHAAGIVHRDLKPENLIVSSDGFVKILDFGLAKLAPPVPTKELSQLPTMGDPTRPGIVMGTVGYMSPEQASGYTLDFRSDQFSFGAILYEMAAGARPFQKTTAVETLSAILREEPAPLSARAPEAPAPLRWIIERCLAKEPEARYASTQDLARELRDLREHLPEITHSGESVAAFPVRASRAGRSRRLFLTAAAAGLLAGAAAMLWWPRPPAPGEPPFVRYLTYSGRDRSPAASPDGRMIAFTSERDGKSRIWLKQLAGGSEAALTDGPDSSPRFSPEGSMILFSRAERKGPSIYRAAVVGGEARRIVDDAFQADWSPDGKHIVFLRNTNEGNNQFSIIGLVNPDGGNPRAIARVENHQLSNPRWSPDGRTIAFSEVVQAGTDRTLFSVDAETGSVQQIKPASPATLTGGPAWCPDGSILYSVGESVIASVTGGAVRVIRQDVKSGRTRTLFWSPGANNALDLLPDGRLVMEANSGRSNLKEMLLEGQAPPRDSRWLTRGNTSDRQPTFSPDGEWVVFSSNRSGNLDLWEISTKTGAVRRLTDDAADDWDPGFTRDGMLIWSSNRSGAFEIWIAESDGSGARQLTRDGGDAENPTATPDGWIVYSQGATAKSGIWKIRPDGSRAARVVEGATQVPEVSPDGKYVSYGGRSQTYRTEVRVARLEDGRATPFRASFPASGLGTAAALGRSKWLPDGKTIIMFGREEGQPYGLYAQSFDPSRDTSGTLRRLAGFDQDTQFESFGISPDGSRMIVGAYEQLSSLLIAERVPGISPRQSRSR